MTNSENKIKRHTISMLVEDHSGVLTRIAGLFSKRGFNIETITVGKTQKKGISKMVITVFADNKTIEQVEKQVNKLIDTLKVRNMTINDSIVRELCLIKISAKTKEEKEEICIQLP